jgi:NACalpha-BTF3-like transcription factor
LPKAYIKDLGAAYEAYQREGDVAALLEAVQRLETRSEESEQRAAPATSLTEEDLHLVCWEYVWS